MSELLHSFQFAWPWLILLLPLPLLVRFWPRQSREASAPYQGPLLIHPQVQQLRRAFAVGGIPALPSNWLSGLLLSLAWSALILTTMQPQWLEPHTELMSEGYDLMLAVDVSGSMEALDFSVEGRSVNRLAVVKGVVGRFVEQRKGDRIGLILFGASAYVHAPLTQDGAAVRALLDQALPRMLGGATAIGDAIGLAVKKLRDRPDGSRVLIMLTDGENTGGVLPPFEATLLAQRYGVRIYAIGVGSEGPVPVPDRDSGEIVVKEMPLDEPLLRSIAEGTGGAYFRATDRAALEAIYDRIDALEKSEVTSRSLMIPRPLYHWPLLVALTCLALLAVNTLYGRRSRLQRSGRL